jgi:hypothetical protein
LRIHTARLTAGLLLACALTATNTGNAAPPATSTAPTAPAASTASTLEAEQEAAFKAAKAVQKTGPADITCATRPTCTCRPATSGCRRPPPRS